MAHRDVVVVGASAGGVEALRALVAGLPGDLPAAVLIVLHVPRSAPSALASILARACSLPVRPAVDGEMLRHGRVYVAVVDRHLLILDNRIRLSRGPSENGHRPAIDPLFRSAARSFGPRVVGVVLSGTRDDGASGLAVVSQLGGITVVQDPADAAYPAMPRAAMNACEVDHVLPIGKIGPLLGEVVRQPAPPFVPGQDPLLDAEVDVSSSVPDGASELGSPATYGCPACGGALYEVSGEPIPRYRCRVGHAWSPESLLEEQSAALESALWMALRSLSEKSALSRQMAGALEERMSSRFAVGRFETMAQDADQAAELIKGLIEEIGATTDGPAVQSTE
ncbi:two-component system chemotaxis response regulator CheB [Hamadaea flava]|uniref:protein-glutamate methylesterase n=1 Tax=Hamadaea flava TaxID=1742688 RepID=A0ABV8LNL0_9ACTN|nr:chemotaxis protein CheB [Hamadaea flava]MCP2323059.1 two-component system chemotaxis response regulator CheB [Hamadaea flava]